MDVPVAVHLLQSGGAFSHLLSGGAKKAGLISWQEDTSEVNIPDLKTVKLDPAKRCIILGTRHTAGPHVSGFRLG